MKLVPLVVLLVLAAAACGAESGVTVDPDSDDELTGRTFLSTKVTEGGSPRDLAPGTRVSLQFTDDGRLIASAGCNSMSGPVDTGGGRLEASDLAMTEMGCDPVRHEQDTWLAGVLGGTPAWRISGDNLVLTAGTTELVLLDRKVAQPDLPLEGTRWTVDTLVEGEVASSSAAADRAFLLFAGGKVSGSAGCNRLSGSAAVEGGAIRFGPVATTKMACEPDVADVERLVLAVLDGEVSYEIDSDRLTLNHPDGKGLGLRGERK